MAARRSFLIATALALLSAQSFASNDDFPNRAIKLVVPFPPGGGVDQVARNLAQPLAAVLKQPVVIDNRGGAGGALGAALVKSATPDGYTLLMGTAGTHGTNFVVQKNLPYDPRSDFEPITLLMDAPYVLVANKSVPYDSIEQLNAYAAANPGRINFGSYGLGSSNYFAAEIYRALSGADITHVPYRGAAPAMLALLAGEIDITFDTLPNLATQLRAQSVKPLGVGSRERSPLYPDMPTVIEAGVPGYISGTFFGVWAPKGTPPAIVSRLNDAFIQVLRQPEVKDTFERIGNRVLATGPASLQERVETEVKSLQRLVEERNLRFD
jgi:tripartite-type tricarboxylate transporter receptor subunit TctC